MHKPESVQENKAHNIIRDFEIQADHLVTTRKPDLVSLNKKSRSPCEFCHSVRFQSENKRK